MLKINTNTEIWKISFACAKSCLQRKLTLKEINQLINTGISEISRDNIIQICANKNIELTLID